MTQTVIAGYARSPFTLANKGALTRVRPDDMLAQVVRGLIEKTGVKPEDIEDIITGCAFPEAEQGFNVARIVALLAEGAWLGRRSRRHVRKAREAQGHA